MFDHISQMNKVDSSSVFLMGGSQGGIVTGLAAEERAQNVRGMILYFPAFNIPDDWRNRFGSVENIPEIFEFWGLTLGRNFVMSMRDCSAFDYIGGYAGPVLILQGGQDTIVTPSVAQRAVKKYQHAELVIFPEDGHGFSPENAKTAMKKTLHMMQLSCKNIIE